MKPRLQRVGAEVNAVKNDQIFQIDNAASSLPNHHVVDALIQMAVAVYPERIRSLCKMKTVYKIVFYNDFIHRCAYSGDWCRQYRYFSVSYSANPGQQAFWACPYRRKLTAFLCRFFGMYAYLVLYFAFFVGAALAVSGTVMQSVLKKIHSRPPYTLGVSSGASLGAAFIILFGISIPALGLFSLPLAGTVFGLLTVFLAMAFASRLDRHMENQTVILVGMVLSLFVNAILTLLTYIYREHMQQLIVWQMGSFSGSDWSQLGVAVPVMILAILVLMAFSGKWISSPLEKSRR